MTYTFIFFVLAIIIWSLLVKQNDSKDGEISESKKHERNPDSTVQHVPKNFIVADIETTGLNHKRNKIIEIGAIKVNRNYNNHQTFAGLVDPGTKLPKKIIDITGITDDMLKGQDDLKTAFKEFLEFIGDLPLVFYNSSFDMAFLKHAAANTGYSINNKVLDALAYSRKAFPDLPNHKLGTVAKHVGVDTTDAHRALKDSAMTLRVFSEACKVIGGWDKFETQAAKGTKTTPNRMGMTIEISAKVSENGKVGFEFESPQNYDKSEWEDLDDFDDDTDPILDRHFELSSIEKSTYKKRTDPKHRKLFIETAEKHLKEIPEIIEAFKKENGRVPQLSIFRLYPTVLTEDGKFDKAIELCEEAMAFGLHDGTKTGFGGRIKRIENKVRNT